MSKNSDKTTPLTKRPKNGTLTPTPSKWHLVLIHDTAQKEIYSWPIEVKKELGSVLTLIQKGLHIGMPDSRLMPTIGPGVSEIRLKDGSAAYRALYTLQTNIGVLIFHAFKKKTQKTPKKEIKIAKRRLKTFLKELKK